MGSWSGVQGTRKSAGVPLAELTDMQRRACILAERLMLIESHITGGRKRREASLRTAVRRAASIGFTAEDITRFWVFTGTLELSTPSEARRLYVQCRAKLAEVLGCAPEDIVATPQRVEQKMPRPSMAKAR